MEQWKLQRHVEDIAKFMGGLTANYGSPVNLTLSKCKNVFAHLKADPFLKDRFFHAVNIVGSQIFFTHRTKEFLDIEGDVTLPTVFATIHGDYLGDYLRWAKAAYSYASHDDIKKLIVPLKQVYRIRIPMKFSVKHGDRYFWVRQESRPLQVDKKKNLVSHLNIYTREMEFHENDRQPLLGDIVDDENTFNERLWNSELAKMYLEDKEVSNGFPFILTTTERRVLETYVKEGSSATSTIVGKLLESPVTKSPIRKNTVKEHNKNILAKAAESWPHLKFDEIKDLARYLENLGFPWDLPRGGIVP